MQIIFDNKKTFEAHIRIELDNNGNLYLTDYGHQQTRVDSSYFPCAPSLPLERRIRILNFWINALDGNLALAISLCSRAGLIAIN